MEQSRRDMMRITAVLGMAFTAGLIKPSEVFGAEWKSGGFDAKTLKEALAALGADKAAVSSEVTISGPDIAENGAVVTVSIASKAPNTEFMAILVEKNPNPLSASFTIPVGTEPAFSTRVKMGGTSNVHALARADGKWLIASKEVKVTLGGCGG